MAPTVLAVADSDSYLKWSAATLGALPADWTRQQVVLRSPIQPSERQIRAAAASAATVRSLPGLLALVRRLDPEVILLACTGPVVQVLAALAPIADGRRVLVTGLPGMSWPASRRAVRFRTGCDLFVVHSRRERAAFECLVTATALDLRLGLARLPFLRGPAAERRGGDGVVFAAQAKVPAEQAQRSAVLMAMADLPDPLRGVVKVRAAAGELQTHHEAYPYPELWDDLVAKGAATPHRIRFSTGSMARALDDAHALVTVSSTAALESMALGLPLIVLSDFGVSAELINLAYADSGCLGTLGDVRAGRFRHPDPAWLADNYLHPAAENDWTEVLTGLLDDRSRTPRASRPRPDPRTLARGVARLLLPRPPRLLPHR